MLKSGVYKIVNIINGKKYVGSAVNFNGRWRKHKNDLKKNNHHSGHLQAAWNKYREESFRFEIIEECEPVKEVLIEREQYYIDTLKPEYNVCLKAYSHLGMKHSEQTKQKLSEVFGGENNPNFGKPMSEEQKKKISQALKGENNPNFGKTGENNPNFGKHRSEETKKKIGEAHRGKHRSEETKQKMSEAQRGEKNPLAKLTQGIANEIRRRYKEEKIFMKDLALEYGVSKGTIQGIVENRTWKEGQSNG